MEKGKKLSLSPAQSVLWTGQQMHPGLPLYNMAFAFHLNGPLDQDCFRTAFDDLVSASESMRLVFNSSTSGAQQKVLSGQPRQLDIINDIDDSVHVKDYLNERVQDLFSIDKCCYDSVLIQINTHSHVWLLNQHHLITDAWGIAVQYRYISDRYAQLILTKNKKAANDAGAKSVEVKGLSSFTEHLEDAAAPKPTPSYWAEQAPPSPVSLYGRKPHFPQTTSDRFSITLGQEQMEKLETLLQHDKIRHWTRNLSLFNVLTTVVFAYLHRTSANQKLSIGTPTLNRQTTKDRNTPGCFIEVLPITVEVSPEDTFLSLHDRVRDSTNDFYSNVRPGLASPELLRGINVTLNYIHASFPDFSDDIKTSTEWIHSGHADPGHHLRILVYNFGEKQGLRLEFDANKDIFPDASGREIPKHLLSLLEAFLETPTSLIGEVPLIDKGPDIAPERSLSTSVEFKSLLDLFSEQVRKSPEKIAIESSDGNLSYQSLEEQSDQLAAFLIEKVPGQRIALFLPRSNELVVAILGVWKANKTYLPIPSTTPFKRINLLLEEGKVDYVISQETLNNITEKLNRPVFQFGPDWHQTRGLILPAEISTPTAENSAYIMFTSGSTGKPKGVVISHSALANYIAFAKEQYVKTPVPVFPLFTSIGFDLTVTSLFTPLVCGGKIRVYKESPFGTPDLAIFDVLKDDQADVLKLTPSHLALLQGKDFSKSKIKTLVVGGENFSTSLAEKILPLFPKTVKVYNEYGPTEATVGCIVYRYKKTNRKRPSVPIGRPIPGVKIRIQDGYGNPVPDGVTGQLFVGGKNLADKYFEDPEKTAQSFVRLGLENKGTFYATGDLVRTNLNRDLEFIGRKDRQVKFRGFRIELNEIESVLTSHPNIELAAVQLLNEQINTLPQNQNSETTTAYISRKDNKSQKNDSQYIAAYLKANTSFSSESIRSYMMELLPPYAVPTHFILMEQMPLTANGKINRKALLEINKVNAKPALKTFISPTGEIEEILAEIWTEVLDIEQISANEKFLDLGGHSLTAIRLSSRISEAFEFEVPLNVVFSHPTIISQAAYIEQAIELMLAEMDAE